MHRTPARSARPCPVVRTRFAPGGLAASVVLVLLATALACARNPVTGRPEAVLTTEQGEIEQGNEAAKIVEEQIGFVDDPALQAYVDALGQRLASQSPRAHLTHTFHVVQMKEPNAFALPGGHIYVSRGLLELANSEDELATVIGHEIGHVAARHSVSRQAASAPLAPVRILAGIGGAAASIVSPSIGRIVSGVGQLPGALALAAYSREQEREADRLGQQYAAAEGFDPEALASMMDALTRDEALAGNDPNRRSFLQSHPSSPERSSDAVAFAQALTVVPSQPPPLARPAFLQKLDGLPVGPAASEGVFIDGRFLHPDLGFGVTFPEGWETANTRNAVGAIQKDQLGQVVVEIVAEGTDPMEQALAFDREVRLADTPRRRTISGLQAAQAECELGGRRDRLRVLVTWIAHRGRIYRVSGVAAERHFGPLEPRFAAVAQSFHPLTDAERAEIHQDRLRIASAREGEQLEALGARTHNQWSVERTAVTNGIEVGTGLAAGQLVKIAVAEPYVARPHAASNGRSQP
jgi:predicted Zn-dependent protease